MQESSSASPTTPVTLPDRAPTESYVMTHGQRRCQMANKHGIQNINEYRRFAVRNSPLRICIGGPAWTQEKKREALVTVGQHLHLMPPLQLQHRIEGAPIVAGKRTTFVSFRVKSFAVDGICGELLMFGNNK